MASLNDTTVFSTTAVHPAMPAALPTELVAGIVAAITPPTPALEALRFSEVARDLGRLDGQAVAELLDQPHDRFGGAYLQLPAYSLVVQADAEFRRHGLVLDGRDRLLRTVRQQARGELVRLHFMLSTLWLIPLTADDLTAVHVGSLMLILGSEGARPWLWPGLPDHGRFRLIGDPASAAARVHPGLHHHRCEGISDFAHLVARLPAHHGERAAVPA